MKFYCSQCGQKIETGETPAGGSLVCPGCGGAASIPLANPAPEPAAPPLQQERFRTNLLITFCVLATLAALFLLLLHPPQSGWCQAVRGAIFGRHLTAAADENSRSKGNETPDGSPTSVPENIASNTAAMKSVNNAIPQAAPMADELPNLSPAPANPIPTNSSAIQEVVAAPAVSVPPTNQTAHSSDPRSELARGQSPANRMPTDPARMPQPRVERPLAETPVNRSTLAPEPAPAPARRSPLNSSGAQVDHQSSIRNQPSAPPAPARPSPAQPDQKVTVRSSSPAPAPAERIARPPAPALASPRFFDTRGRGTNLVYVMDRSDSMKTTDGLGGSRLIAARQELINSLNNLPSGASICVIFYDNTFESMPENGLLPATSANLARIVEWINAQTPRGDTDPTRAMWHALELKPDTIWLLSDGQFEAGVGESILRANRDLRVMINTISFHDQSGKNTLEQIASENDGIYRFVPPPANASAPPAAIREP